MVINQGVWRIIRRSALVHNVMSSRSAMSDWEVRLQHACIQQDLDYIFYVYAISIGNIQ